MYSKIQQLVLLKAMKDMVKEREKGLRAEEMQSLVEDYLGSGSDRRAVFFGGEKVATVSLEGKSDPYVVDDWDAFLDYANEVDGLDVRHKPIEKYWEEVYQRIPSGYRPSLFEVEERPSQAFLDSLAVIGGRVVNQATGEVVPGLRAQPAVPTKMVIRNVDRKNPAKALELAAREGGLESFLLGGGEDE